MISLRHITKTYGEKNVFADLNLAIAEGEVTVLMAPSGYGKTTLLRLVLGLEQPDTGEIEGCPGTCAVVFQEDRLCGAISAIANLALVCDEKREMLEQRLLEAGLDAQALARPAASLSGGEARRVAILRALAAKAELLVFDEPLKGLDEEARSRMLELIARYRQGRTLLWVTHDVRDADFWESAPLRLDQIASK